MDADRAALAEYTARRAAGDRLAREVTTTFSILRAGSLWCDLPELDGPIRRSTTATTAGPKRDTWGCLRCGAPSRRVALASTRLRIRHHGSAT